MRRTTVGELLDRYDIFWLDLYGVLVDGSGALPGAAAFLEALAARGKTVLFLSNDASRSPESAAARYAGFGLPVAADRLLNSGMLIADYFAGAGLAGGARAIVLGTADSAELVRRAGGIVVPADDASADVVVVADDDDYPFLDTVNAVVTVLFRRLDAGQRTHLLLPNPDLVYPRAAGAYGVTAGAVAALIEAALTVRDPAGGLRFTPLGKPHAPMFEAARRRSAGELDRRRVVMIGDQLGTDVRGARDFGVDSVLALSGVGRLAEIDRFGVSPTWILLDLLH